MFNIKSLREKSPILRCMEYSFNISWSFPRVKSGVLVLIISSHKKKILLDFPFVSEKVVIFTKTFYIKQIKKLAYHRSYYKIFENIMLLTLGIKHLNPHQVTLVLGLIMQNDLALIPTVKYRTNYLTTIVPYPWKVAV